MSDLQLNLETKDLDIVNGDLVLTSGVDDIRQRLQQALLAIRGDWFLNLFDGVPYYQDVLVKNPNASVIDGIFKDTILGVAGVVELLSFSLELDPATRELSLDFAVQTSLATDPLAMSVALP